MLQDKSLPTAVFLCDLMKDAVSYRVMKLDFSLVLNWRALGGVLTQVFPHRSSGLHPAVSSALRGAQLKVTLQPCCRGEFGT